MDFAIGNILLIASAVVIPCIAVLGIAAIVVIVVLIVRKKRKEQP